jgi:hypothetical protein
LSEKRHFFAKYFVKHIFKIVTSTTDWRAPTPIPKSAYQEQGRLLIYSSPRPWDPRQINGRVCAASKLDFMELKYPCRLFIRLKNGIKIYSFCFKIQTSKRFLKVKLLSNSVVHLGTVSNPDSV